MAPSITMLYGLPGSGKSTLASNYAQEGYIVINRDTLGGTIASLVPRVKALLTEGKPVLLDNTHLTKESRTPFLALAQEMGVPIHIRILDTSMEDCQINVLRRMYEHHGQIFPCGKKGDAQAFAPVVLFNARKKAQEPDMAEGFTSVQNVLSVQPIALWSALKYMNKALFLDIDGTLRATEHLANKYPTRTEEVVALYDVALMKTVLDRYRSEGYLLVGISNQSGIAKGVLSEADAKACFEATRALFGYGEGDFPILYCPHRAAPPVCYCRKPQSGLFVEACERWHIQPSASLMIGDMKTDETAARRMDIPFKNSEKFWKDEFAKGKGAK
jgi:D-glycero-D-manno-heptose 1,7-bisphosphate phosphatase